jgi:hypothetical protein
MPYGFVYGYQEFAAVIGIIEKETDVKKKIQRKRRVERNQHHKQAELLYKCALENNK